MKQVGTVENKKRTVHLSDEGTMEAQHFKGHAYRDYATIEAKVTGPEDTFRYVTKYEDDITGTFVTPSTAKATLDMNTGKVRPLSDHNHLDTESNSRLWIPEAGRIEVLREMDSSWRTDEEYTEVKYDLTSKMDEGSIPPQRLVQHFTKNNNSLEGRLSNYTLPDDATEVKDKADVTYHIDTVHFKNVDQGLSSSDPEQGIEIVMPFEQYLTMGEPEILEYSDNFHVTGT